MEETDWENIVHKTDQQLDFEDMMVEEYERLPGGEHYVPCPEPTIIESENGPTPISRCRNLDDLHHMIIHLNDYHKWPREKIADYVESFEDVVDLSFKAVKNG